VKVVSFVQEHKSTFGVEPLLAILGEPVSTFYNRVGRKPSARALEQRRVARADRGGVGAVPPHLSSPRVHAMLLR